MSKRLEPRPLKLIFDKPGKAWTQNELRAVKVWLNQEPQLTYLLHFALRHLGYGATAEDAEDAWGNFFLDQFDSRRAYYDPGRKKRFWNFLLYVFAQYCWQEGDKIRRRKGIETPFEMEAKDEKGNVIQLELSDPNPTVDPVQVLEKREALERLQDCVNRLRSNYRAVFVLQYFEYESIGAIAGRLGTSEGNVRVMLHRARTILAFCMETEGQGV